VPGSHTFQKILTAIPSRVFPQNGKKVTLRQVSLVKKTSRQVSFVKKTSFKQRYCLL
jgi:hypothetical protein